MDICHRCRIGLVAILLAAAALAAGAAEPRDAAQPLTNEDVMRMWVQGVPAGRIIETLRGAEVAFDLSEELRHELRRAGLPHEVLRAMELHQRRFDDERLQRLATPPSGPFLELRVNSAQAKRDRRSLVLRDEVDSIAALAWKLGNSERERRYTDIALFVACRTPTHVPDQWRLRTPLRWDGELMPRHRMLAFSPGADWTETAFLRLFNFRPSLSTASDLPPRGSLVGTLEAPDRRPGTLRYELPPQLLAPLEPGVPHDLTVGIALQVADSYYPWSISALDGVVIGEAYEALEVRVRGVGARDLSSIDIAFDSDEARHARAIVVQGSCVR